MITPEQIYNISDQLIDAAASTQALQYIIQLHERATEGHAEEYHRYDFIKACQVLSGHIQAIIDTQIDVLDHMEA